jgi:hypothetical protein
MKYLLYITILVSACTLPTNNETTDPRFFTVHFRVVDDEQMPVPGSQIIINERTLYGSSRGTVTDHLPGQEGDAVITQVVCPAGWYTPQANQKQLILKNFTSSEAAATNTRELEFICVPKKKNHVLIVKSSQPLLPIQINGKTVMHTDTGGFAQLVMSGPPGERIHLQISTEEHPLLVPRNPSLVVTLPAKRKFLVFEQSFETVKPVSRKRKARRPGPRRL